MRLVDPTPETYKVLLELLRSQLTEGSGETMFEIGVGGWHQLLSLMFARWGTQGHHCRANGKLSCDVDKTCKRMLCRHLALKNSQGVFITILSSLRLFIVETFFISHPTHTFVLPPNCDVMQRNVTLQEEGGDVVEYLVRNRCDGDDFIEVRVAVVGNVDAGKRYFILS